MYFTQFYKILSYLNNWEAEKRQYIYWHIVGIVHLLAPVLVQKYRFVEKTWTLDTLPENIF